MKQTSNFGSGLPFADFVHCPNCGNKPFSRHGDRALSCAQCGFKFYFNCASATGAFLFHRGQLILGVRGKEPQKGLLDLPGGFIEYDETAEDALIREVKEELNLAVSSLIYLTSAPNDYLYAGVLYKTTDIYFIGKVEDISAIKARDDVADFCLIAPEALDPQQLAFPSGRKALRHLLERSRADPNFLSNLSAS